MKWDWVAWTWHRNRAASAQDMNSRFEAGSQMWAEIPEEVYLRGRGGESAAG